MKRRAFLLTGIASGALAAVTGPKNIESLRKHAFNPEDGTAALIKAEAEAHKNGTALILPKNEVIGFSKPIEIRVPVEGNGSTFVSLNPSSTLRFKVGTDKLSLIRELHFNAAGLVGGILISDSKNLQVNNCSVRNCVGGGLCVLNSSDILLFKNEVHYPQLYGMHVESSEHVELVKNHVVFTEEPAHKDSEFIVIVDSSSSAVVENTLETEGEWRGRRPNINCSSDIKLVKNQFVA